MFRITSPLKGQVKHLSVAKGVILLFAGFETFIITQNDLLVVQGFQILNRPQQHNSLKHAHLNPFTLIL